MKNFLTYIFLVLSILVLLPNRTLAVSIGEDMGKQLGAAGTNAGYDAPTDPRTTVANIIKVILSLIGTIFLALTIYAGFLWMTAGGNDEQITKAKSYIYQATIGLIIVLGAYAITVFAIKIATGSADNQGNNPSLPPQGLDYPKGQP